MGGGPAACRPGGAGAWVRTAEVGPASGAGSGPRAGRARGRGGGRPGRAEEDGAAADGGGGAGCRIKNTD